MLFAAWLAQLMMPSVMLEFRDPVTTGSIISSRTCTNCSTTPLHCRCAKAAGILSILGSNMPFKWSCLPHCRQLVKLYFAPGHTSIIHDIVVSILFSIIPI